jgi:hypothetical protein
MKPSLPITLATLAATGLVVATAFVSSHSDVVIHVDPARGVAFVRDSHTGKVMAFQASAQELGAIKIGDPVRADWKVGTLTELKGVRKTAALIQPDYGEPCCAVVVVAKDKAIANGLLSGLVTDGGKPYDAVAPFHGIIVAKDNKTGKYHVLDTSVLSEKEAPAGAPQIMEMSKLVDEVKVDTPVWVNGKYGMFKQGNTVYSFRLRGADNDGGPWVIEPDAEAVGRYGLIRTNWHEKSSSNHQSIKVYLPGKRDADEYHEVWKQKHSVMEGEYDIMINGMVLEKVPIKAGHSTRILMGALHFTAPYAQQLHIMDTKDRAVRTLQGGETVALPIGTYHLKVGTRTVNVEVKENEVTDF